MPGSQKTVRAVLTRAAWRSVSRAWLSDCHRAAAARTGWKTSRVVYRPPTPPGHRRDPRVLNSRMTDIRTQQEVHGLGLSLRPWGAADADVLLRGVTDPEYLRWNTP